MVPYSQVLAARREEAAKAVKSAAAARKAASKRSIGWCSTTDGDETASASQSRSSAGPGGKVKGLSAKAVLRRYRAKVKPRTWLYGVFFIVSSVALSCCSSCCRIYL